MPSKLDIDRSSLGLDKFRTLFYFRVMSKLVQPAKQDRSRETQDRILRAAQKLLRRELFESISVRRIIGEAETSIGSFYARFRDKDALLPVLHDQYEVQLRESLIRLQESTAKARSLDAVAEQIVEHFVELYGTIPNLSRALFEYATRSPQATESKQLAQRRSKQYSFLYESLLAFRSEITHSDPPRGVELAVYFMVVACRNRLLYPLAPQTRTLKISQAELKQELVRLLTGYLRS
jgi:AcrR family transcriptional regulator